MGRTSWLAALAMLGAVAGCGSNPDHPEALEGMDGHDSGVVAFEGGTIRDVGVPDTHVCANTGDAGCNDLELCGSEIGIQNVTTTAPMATGGTITDGKYLLTSMTFYQPAGGQPLTGTSRQVLQISGAASSPFTLDQISQATGATPTSLTWSIAVQPPSTLVWTASCPSGMQTFQLGYTATASSLLGYDDTGAGIWEFTYTLQ